MHPSCRCTGFGGLPDDSFSFPLPSSINIWSFQNWIPQSPWWVSHPNVCVLSSHSKMVNSVCCPVVLLNFSGNLLHLRHNSIIQALELHGFSSLGHVHYKVLYSFVAGKVSENWDKSRSKILSASWKLEASLLLPKKALFLLATNR